MLRGPNLIIAGRAQGAEREPSSREEEEEGKEKNAPLLITKKASNDEIHQKIITVPPVSILTVTIREGQLWPDMCVAIEYSWKCPWNVLGFQSHLESLLIEKAPMKNGGPTMTRAHAATIRTVKSLSLELFTLNLIEAPSVLRDSALITGPSITKINYSINKESRGGEARANPHGKLT